MEDNCQSNCSHDICNPSRVRATGCVKVMEMAPPEDRMSARRGDLCISMQLMNRPNCSASKVGWLKNVISISPRRGASILATRLSKYLLIPRYLRQVRAGRTTRSSGGGGKLR